jgi:intracellular septation protein
MKLLYEFLPIALFFVAYKFYGIYTATAVAISVIIVQVAWSWFKHKKVEKMLLTSMVIILVLGGLTLWLRDKSFIMLKPSIINWAFALVFLGSQFIGEKPLIERMMGSQISLTENKWPSLNVAWVIFFIFSGFANLFFALNYQSSEAELKMAYPQITVEQIEKLDCSTFGEQNIVSLCNVTKEKEELWVNFKLFGLLSLTVLFVILQGFFLTKYIVPEPEEPDTKTEKD